MDRQKGVLDRKIKRHTSTETNNMDDKNVYASFGFLNEIFILNEIEKLEIIYLPTSASRKIQICSVLNLTKALVFDYGYTMNLLLTN